MEIFKNGETSIKKLSSLDDLENTWKNLEKNQLYLSFESVKSYVQNVIGNDIMIFCLYEKNKLVGIFPVRYEDSVYGRKYYIISHNFGFNLEPIGKELSNLFIYKVLEDLNGIAFFDTITENFFDVLKQSVENADLKYKCGKSHEHLYKLTLGTSWDDFLKTLDGKFRKNLRYYQKRLSENFKVEFERSTTPKDFKTFFELHSLSMSDRNDLSILEFKPFQKYYTDMVSNFGKNSGLFNLLVNKEIAASLLFIDFNDTRYFLNIGVLPKYKEYSVSRILIAHVIGDSIKRGIKYFDFGKGDSPYKLDWGCEVIGNRKILIWRNNFQYFLYNLSDLFYGTIKKVGISVLKINLLKRILLKRNW